MSGKKQTKKMPKFKINNEMKLHQNSIEKQIEKITAKIEKLDNQIERLLDKRDDLSREKLILLEELYIIEKY